MTRLPCSQEKNDAPQSLEDSRAGESVLDQVLVCQRRPKVTAVQSPRDESVLRESVQGGSNHRNPELCLFSNHAGLPPPWHDQIQPAPCLVLRGCLLMVGALTWGSPNCWSHRRSLQRAHSGVHPGHLQGGWKEWADSDNIKAPCDSSPRFLPFRRAWTWQHS